MDPLQERELASEALDAVAKAAADYLSGLDERRSPIRPPWSCWTN